MSGSELSLGWEVAAGWRHLWKEQCTKRQRSAGPPPGEAAASPGGGKPVGGHACLNLCDLASVPLMHFGFKTGEFID